jgi:hypothetical protein
MGKTMTQRERNAERLRAAGEKAVLDKDTKRYWVYTCSRRPGEFYWLGKAGAVRIGRTISGSFVARLP